MTAIDECTLDLQVSTAHLAAMVEAQLDILRPNLQLPQYVQQLKALYGFCAPAERELASSGLPWYFADWHPMQRTGWLESDLSYFDVPFEKLRLDDAVPNPLSTGRAFGWLYTLETLCNTRPAIQRHISAKLNLDNKNGLRFYSGGGLSSKQRWQRYEEALTALCTAHPEAHIAVVDGARHAFGSLSDWLHHNSEAIAA